MTCTAIRSWRCCHGCSKLSSHFKIKENVLSRLCISATHVENLSNRRKKKKKSKLYKVQPSLSRPPFPFLEHICLQCQVTGAHSFCLMTTIFFRSTVTPQAGKAAEHKQAFPVCEGVFFSLQKKHKMQKEDEWVLVSEQVFISKHRLKS